MTNPDDVESQSESTDTGYRIEARVERERTDPPYALPDGVLTEKWRFVDVVKLGVVLPPSSVFARKSEAGLMSHATAMSVAWNLVASFPYGGVEVRLVRYRLRTTRKLTKEGVLGDVVKGQDHLDVADTVDPDEPR